MVRPATARALSELQRVRCHLRLRPQPPRLAACNGTSSRLSGAVSCSGQPRSRRLSPVSLCSRWVAGMSSRRGNCPAHSTCEHGHMLAVIGVTPRTCRSLSCRLLDVQLAA